MLSSASAGLQAHTSLSGNGFTEAEMTCPDPARSEGLFGGRHAAECYHPRDLAIAGRSERCPRHRFRADHSGAQSQLSRRSLDAW